MLYIIPSWQIYNGISILPTYYLFVYKYFIFLFFSFSLPPPPPLEFRARESPPFPALWVGLYPDCFPSHDEGIR